LQNCGTKGCKVHTDAYKAVLAFLITAQNLTATLTHYHEETSQKTAACAKKDSWHLCLFLKLWANFWRNLLDKVLGQTTQQAKKHSWRSMGLFIVTLLGGLFDTLSPQEIVVFIVRIFVLTVVGVVDVGG